MYLSANTQGDMEVSAHNIRFITEQADASQTTDTGEY